MAIPLVVAETDPAAKVSRTQAVRWWAVLGAETLLLSSPLLVTDFPPLSDLPNHMARLYVIAMNGTDPVLSQMYRPVWHILPNLAIDLIGPGLIKLTSVSVAARLLVAIGIMLCLAGTIALHRALFHRRSYWPLAVGVVLYNGLFLMGFLNFIYGTGLALLGAAMAISTNPFLSRHRTAISVAFAVVIFFAHLFPLIFYFLIVFIHEVIAVNWQAGARLRQAFRLSVRVIAPTILPSLLFLLSPRPDAADQLFWGSLAQRTVSAATPLINYDRRFDMASLVLLLALLGILIYRNAVIIPRLTLLALPALVGLFILCPFGLGGATYVDARLMIFVGFLVFAGLAPSRPAPRLQMSIAVLVTILLCARIGFIGVTWHQSVRDLRDIEALGELLPIGSKLFVTKVVPDEDRVAYFRDEPASRELRGLDTTFYHLPALWVMQRRIFYPVIFHNPGQQPLEILPPYEELLLPAGIPPDYRALFDPRFADPGERAYLANWQKNFDDVVVLGAGRAEHLDQLNGLPLVLLGKTDIAALYRVVK